MGCSPENTGRRVLTRDSYRILGRDSGEGQTGSFLGMKALK